MLKIKMPPITHESEAVPVVKARIGWWVDGRWCPTEKIRDRELKAAWRRRDPAGGSS